MHQVTSPLTSEPDPITQRSGAQERGPGCRSLSESCQGMVEILGLGDIITTNSNNVNTLTTYPASGTVPNAETHCLIQSNLHGNPPLVGLLISLLYRETSHEGQGNLMR